MRGKVKNATKKASRLHGATATYVSLVDRGANETPFTLIKSKEGKSAMGIKKRGKAQKSHKPLASKKRKQDATTETRTETLIAKMVIDGERFETEEEVLEFVQSADWDADEYVITKDDDDDWEVRAKGVEDDDFEDLSELDISDQEDSEGVTVFIGKREVEVEVKDDDEDEAETEAETEAKSDDDAEEEEEEEEEEAEVETKSKAKPKPKAAAKKTETVSKRAAFLARRKEQKSQRDKLVKFDAWDARWSKGNTLVATIKAGMEYDGLPPGYYDVQAAAASAFANIVSNEDLEGVAKQEALNKAGADFAEIIGGLDTFFDAFLDADEETLAKSYEDEAEREALIKWADDFGDFLADPTAAPAPATEKKSKQSIAKGVEGAGALDLSKLGDMIAEQVKKSVGDIADRVEEVSGTVEAMASRSQTKKAKDADELGTAKDKATKTAEEERQAEVQKLDDWRRETQAKGFLG